MAESAPIFGNEVNLLLRGAPDIGAGEAANPIARGERLFVASGCGVPGSPMPAWSQANGGPLADVRTSTWCW
jgi:hypothetical protein